ncbi:DUF4097 family beta strand repeat-containing protein [Clostridium paraputrificum]|uniref:DUF4097 family beta strand repeat-containing protein n=1 Tax=Clostridium TaxID=1485 RepID=UPI003D34CD9D
MKKLLAMVTIIVVSLTISGCSVKLGMDKRNSNSDKNIEKTVSVEGVKSLMINTDMSKINVMNYDGDEIKITAELSDSTKGIDISQVGDKLDISEKTSGANFSIFGKSNYNASDIEISIPKNFKGDITITQGVGEIIMEGLRAEKLTLKGGAGEIRGSEIVCNKLKVDAGVGDIKLFLAEKSGDIDINGGVGEINLEIAEVGGNLEYKGGVGSARIRIPNNAPVKFNAKSGLGNCDIKAKTSNESKYVFDLSVGIGEIKVLN